MSATGQILSRMMEAMEKQLNFRMYCAQNVRQNKETIHRLCLA